MFKVLRYVGLIIYIGVLVLIISFVGYMGFEFQSELKKLIVEVDPSIIQEIEECRKGKVDKVVSLYMCKPRKDGWAMLKPLKEVRDD